MKRLSILIACTLCVTTAGPSYAKRKLVLRRPSRPSRGWEQLRTAVSWSGACSGTSRTCTLSMSQAMSASANFNLRPVSQTLSVTRTGDGSGTVSSSPSGIN